MVVEASLAVALDAPDSTIDALLKVDLPDDPERAAQDAAADLLAQEGAGEFSRGESPKAAGVQSSEPLITVEEATQRLGSKVMAALADKFNGELTVVRHPDEKDMLL